MKQVERQTRASLRALRASKHLTAEYEGTAALAVKLAHDIDESDSVDPAKARELRMALMSIQTAEIQDRDGFGSFAEEAGQAT